MRCYLWRIDENDRLPYAKLTDDVCVDIDVLGVVIVEMVELMIWQTASRQCLRSPQAAVHDVESAQASAGICKCIVRKGKGDRWYIDR